MTKGTFESNDEFDEDDDYTDSEEPEYHAEADDPGVFWCPACGAEMYGDSTRCPKCGDYVTPGARGASGRPWWIWIGLIAIGLGLIAAFVAAARR
ncbi:MAG TPA: hypothetical protein VNM14_19045 [Planctomycetota bacterium]|nr:hypothetical protein [Planctomycetota bacterium]